ncbi:MAG TPA: ATP-binding protein [Stellaceae bacterium]|nr:ATP-binding protein [Stellaceae bacterium]
MRDLAPGDYVLATVRDTGIGVPPDVLAQAFKPRLTPKGVGQGSGLGLSMADGCARQSGGPCASRARPLSALSSSTTCRAPPIRRPSPAKAR